MTDIVEIMARAAFVHFSRTPGAGDRWDNADPTKRGVSEIVREQFRSEAKAAISALQNAGFDIVARQRRVPF